MISHSRILPMDGAFNLRDLGGYALADGGQTRFGQGLRSDGLARLSPRDIDQLLGLGLRRVIDLRAPHEVRDYPGRLTGVAGVEVLNLPLFDNLAPDFSDMPAGTEPLIDFYIEALEARGATIREVLEAIAEGPEGAVLFHCSAGKDRTGLIAALWLSIAGAARADVIADYALTAELIPGLITMINAELTRRGMNPERLGPMLACRPEFLETALARVEASHGDLSGYLRNIGVTEATQSALRARLA